MASLANINIKFSADLKEFSTSMQNATRSMEKMGAKLKDVGKTLSIGLTAPIVGLGVIAVKTFTDFEQSMAKVAAVSGASVGALKALNQSALDLGASTRYTSAQVAELQLNYSKLGFSPDEILKVTSATLDLALATGEDLATSATVAASTLRAFGLEAEEMQRVVDVMAKSFSSSALDLEKFQTAMGDLAPVAKNAGVSIEEATSYLSILVDRGVDASTAGTGLRNIFLDLAGTGESLESAMNSIATSTNKNKAAFDAFGKRGAVVAAIMADNSAEAKELEKAYIGSAGAAKAMAKIVGTTLEGAMLEMKSAIEGAAIALGQELAPYIKQAANFAAGLATSFKNLSSETKGTIIVVAGLAAAIGPILLVLGLLMTSVIPGLITAFGYLRAGLLLLQGGFIKLTAVMIANPFGALAVAIAAIAAYFIFFNDKVDETIKKQSVLAEINDVASKSIANEKAKLQELLFIARDENIQKSARLKAIKELNALSPKFLGDLTLEKINTDDARKAIELYNLELLKTAKIKAAQAKLQDLQSKIIDLEIKSENASIASAKKISAFKKDAVSIEDQLLKRAIDKVGPANAVVDIYSVQVDKLKEQEKQILKIIAANQVLNTVVSGGGKSKGIGDGAGSRKKATALDGPSAAGMQGLGANTDLSGTIISNEAVTELTAFEQRLMQFNETATGIMQDTAIGVGEGFGNLIGGLASGNLSMKDVAGGLMSIIGDMAIRLGKAAIGIGIAMKSIKLAFKNPFTAIAAGIALIALGAIIKTSIPNITSGGGGNTPAFANGGIMGGNSFSGDKLFARINSGEMILNKRQQNNVAAGLGGAKQNVNVNLVGGVRISMRQLIFDIREEEKKLSRTQG